MVYSVRDFVEDTITIHDTGEVLSYEREFHYSNVAPDHREYYKKLENGKYLCLTIENYDMYLEAYNLNYMFEFDNSEESDRYGTVGCDTYRWLKRD